MQQKPDALVVHALPGRVRFRVPVKKGDRVYFDELVGAISNCGGLEKLVINPTTASVLILYDAGHTGELNGFLEKNNFFQVADRPKQSAATDSSEGSATEQKGERMRQTSPEIPRVLGLGLVGWSCYKLLVDGLMSPPWHAALWYGYNLLRNDRVDKQSGSGTTFP